MAGLRAGLLDTRRAVHNDSIIVRGVEAANGRITARPRPSLSSSLTLLCTIRSRRLLAHGDRKTAVDAGRGPADRLSAPRPLAMYCGNAYCQLLRSVSQSRKQP